MESLLMNIAKWEEEARKVIKMYDLAGIITDMLWRDESDNYQNSITICGELKANHIKNNIPFEKNIFKVTFNGKTVFQFYSKNEITVFHYGEWINVLRYVNEANKEFAKADKIHSDKMRQALQALEIITNFDEPTTEK